MSYLELAKKIQAEIEPNADTMFGLPPCDLSAIDTAWTTGTPTMTTGANTKTQPPAVDLIIDENAVAVLIDSTALGAPIWFAFRDGWLPDEVDNIPIFYASELPALRAKTPEQLRSIFNVKRTFTGGMVRQ